MEFEDLDRARGHIRVIKELLAEQRYDAVERVATHSAEKLVGDKTRRLFLSLFLGLEGIPEEIRTTVQRVMDGKTPKPLTDEQKVKLDNVRRRN